MGKSNQIIIYGVVATIGLGCIYGIKQLFTNKESEPLFTNKGSEQSGFLYSDPNKPTRNFLGNPQDDTNNIKYTGKTYDTVTLGGKRQSVKKNRKNRKKNNNKTKR